MTSVTAAPTVFPRRRLSSRAVAQWVSAKHDTDRVVLVVTQGNDALLETAFAQVFNAQQRAKWLEEGDSLRHALLDTVQASRRSVGHLAEHVTPYERNVVVGVAGRSSRSMWAALQTELQMNDSSDFVVYAHPEVADMPFVEGDLMERWRLTLPRSAACCEIVKIVNAGSFGMALQKASKGSPRY